MKWIFALLVTVAVAFAGDRPPVPGTPKGAPASIQNQALSQCKVPPWLAALPPEMEPDYKECVNTVHKPTDMKALTVLKQQISKKAELVSVEAASQFYTRVYRIRYTVGGKESALLCNDDVSYCVPDAPALRNGK